MVAHFTAEREEKFMITVKKITQKELPRKMVFQMTYLHKMTLDEFVVMVDDEKEIMYVNVSVPQNDIDDFVEIVTFPGGYINDYEDGLGMVTDRVFQKYGAKVYLILVDAYNYRQMEMKKRKAKEMAKMILPLVENEVSSEDPVIGYDEMLISEIRKAGNSSNRKTLHNITDFGGVYLFYLGYLMGNGKIIPGQG